MNETTTSSDGPQGCLRAALSKPDDEKIHLWLEKDVVAFFPYANELQISITVKEYIQMIIHESETLAHFLESSGVDLALALTTSTNARFSDVCLLQTFQTCGLYRIGLGQETFVEQFDSYHFRETLQDCTKRWIIVPCTDGMSEVGDESEEHTRQKEHGIETNVSRNEGRKQASRTDTNRAYGFHWGLMIVDRKKKTAFWLDSALKFGDSQEIKNEKRITHMFDAGRVAGLVLCGIEKVLKFKRGKMDVRTLKYVPQQRNSNNYEAGDSGACGPYLVAMLDYIYRNDYLSDTNLRDIFTRRDLRKHINDFGFHSLRQRQSIQRMIQREEQKQHPERPYPIQLSADLIRILGLDKQSLDGPRVSEAYLEYKRRQDTGS